MTRRGVFGLLVALTAFAAVAGCTLPGFEPRYRFRMTVEVQTPEGLKTGSSVMEVVAGKGIAVGDSSGVSSAIRGEAVAVDLLGGPIFVLLTLPDAGGSLQGHIREALLDDPSDSPDGVIADVARLGRGVAGEYQGDLPRDKWPMMVRFRDIADPKSVERVEPEAIGVTRIRLETTRDPVTMAIEKRLAWLRDGGLTLDPEAGPTTNPTFPQTVRQRAFSTEIER